MVQPPLPELRAWLEKINPVEAFRALAELSSQSAVFAVDADRRIVFWSDGATRLLGFQPESVLGEHCLKANRCQTCMVGCGLARLGTLQNIPLTLYAEDGRSVSVSKSARAFFDTDGQFAGGIELLAPRSPDASTPSSTNTLRHRDAQSFHRLASRDPAMLRVFQVIRNVAETETTALIRGESGTGKELVAEALHSESKRFAGPFVAVNCAALTASLVESELFGHVRGAFTGAVKDRKGLFQQAHRGTLFLDEVAELPLDVQAKLLRVLEEREVLPVGATKATPVDVRVLSATHRSLKERVDTGQFREDLMYRLRVVPIYLPPLRARPSDIELLFWHFVSLGNKIGPRRVTSVSPGTMRRLLHHNWPGNVRELRNTVEYAFAVGRGECIEPGDLPLELESTLQRGSLPISERPSAPSDASPQGEGPKIARLLALNKGHIGRTAAMLGVSRPTLWRKRKKYGL